MYRLTALCEDARTLIARLSAVAVGLGAWLRALAIAGRSQVVWGVLPGSVVLTVMVVTRDGGHRAVDARILRRRRGRWTGRCPRGCRGDRTCRGFLRLRALAVDDWADAHRLCGNRAAALGILFGRPNGDATAGRDVRQAGRCKRCGVCPLEASSGKTVRHRFNRGGNRDANRALHVILVMRLRRHQPSRDYLTRRLAQGKTKNEIMRCLKRHRPRNLPRPTPAQKNRRTRCLNIGASGIKGGHDQATPTTLPNARPPSWPGSPRPTPLASGISAQRGPAPCVFGQRRGRQAGPGPVDLLGTALQHPGVRGAGRPHRATLRCHRRRPGPRPLPGIDRIHQHQGPTPDPDCVWIPRP